MSGSSQIRSETCILLRKSIHVGLHTEVNLKNRFCASAKRHKVLDGRSCIFQKKYAFRAGVVTSMCVPPIENGYFFLKSSDLQSKTRIFLSRSCQIRSGSSQISSETCILLRKSTHVALTYTHHYFSAQTTPDPTNLIPLSHFLLPY